MQPYRFSLGEGSDLTSDLDKLSLLSLPYFSICKVKWWYSFLDFPFLFLVPT